MTDDKFKGVEIDLEGVKDIFEVVERTIQGEIDFHEALEVQPAKPGYRDGFLAGMRQAKDAVSKTRSAASVIHLFDDLPMYDGAPTIEQFWIEFDRSFND